MKLPQGTIKVVSLCFFLILAMSFMAAQELRQHVDNPGQTADKAPTGHVPGVPATTIEPAKPGPIGQAVVTGNGINYHNGPVMRGNPVNAYIVWYGNWSSTGSNTAATKSLIEHFLGTIGGSNIEKVNTTYGDTIGNVSGNVRFGGSTTNTSTANLSDAGVQSVVANALNAGALPRDSNGVYFVLTSSGVSETSGFCTQYCGWHTHATLGGVDIKYSFVGNPDRCPSGCEAQTTGPNSPATGVGGADGMANVMSHELEEAISNPDLNAWFDANGEENADKCNFNFGALYTCTSTSICSAAAKAAGSRFNQTFGNNDWLLQQNWRNSGGGACAQHL